MGVRSPFGYVDYEAQMGNLFRAIMTDLCATCHTNRDYEKGCQGCPAGTLLFACKAYILDAEERDKTFKLYASEEWQERKRQRGISEENIAKERQRDLAMAKEYQPESRALRAMKEAMRPLKPRPYIEHGGEPPLTLDIFKRYLGDYIAASRQHLEKQLGKQRGNS